MKKLIAVMLMAVMLCGCSSSTKSEHDFRNADWGMSVKEVVDSEGKEADTYRDGFIAYNDVLVADFLPMSIMYNFENSKLDSASYGYIGYLGDVDSTFLIDTATKLQDNLTETYKKPLSIESELPTEITENAEFEYVVKWETDNTKIKLSFDKSADSGIAYISIFYSCISE